MDIRHQEKGYHPVRFNRPKPDDNWPYRHRPVSGDDRQYGNKSPKFERHIFVRRDQLLFDIDSQLSMIADARKSPDGTQDDTIANATTKYAQMFFRWMNTHLGEAKAVMAAFVLERSTETAMDSIKDNEETDITLLFPEWYDDTTFPQLSDAVHAYIVNATMADFCIMRLTSKDPVTIDMKEQKELGLSDIRRLVNMAKPGRISKPLQPF